MRGILLLIVALLLAGAWWATRDREPPPRAERPERPPVAPPRKEEPEKPLSSHRLVGKVTGDAPLGDVRVRAEWEGGAGEGRTRDDGTYGIGNPDDGAIRLLAEAPDGRVGFADAPAGASRAPDIALRPAAGVTFVTEPVVPGARLEIGHGGGKDWFWPFAAVRTGADGTATLRLPLGEHGLRGFAEGFGRVSFAFKVEAEAQRVAVPFPAERRLTVTVVEKTRLTPVAGARLSVFASSGAPYGVPEVVTDAKGAARVRGLGAADKISLLVIPPGEVTQEEARGSFDRRRPVPGGVTEVTIEIGLPRAIEWEVLQGDIPPPDDGTVIPLRPLPGATVTPPPTGVMRGGRLVAEGWPFELSVGSEALGPRGTVARLWCAAEVLVGTPAKFELSRTLAVTLLKPGGEPAPGTSVALFNGGNNLIRQAVAGDDGIARMEQLAAEVADIFVLGKGEYDRRELVGTVDLRQGGVAVTHTLTPEKRYEVTILLDGRPYLPEACGVRVNGEFQFTAERDPEQGRITGTFVPRSPLASISVMAQGYRQVTEQVEVPAGDEPLRHTFELDCGFECRIRIVGEQPKRIRLEFQKEWPAGFETIDRDGMSPRASRRDAEDGWVYTGLDAGRYRMRTSREGILWGPVEVSGAGATLVLDFTRVATIRGRVEMPEGHAFKEVQLELRGDGMAEEQSDARPGFSVNWEDGTFDVQIPGDRPVRLSARHPLLSCEAPIETTAGIDGTVLRLVEGPVLSFRLPGYEEKYAPFLKSYPQWQRPLRVRLSGDRAPVDLTAMRKDGTWIAGGFAAGRYDVWIDVPEAVPQLLRSRDLKAGRNDLGDVPSIKGSSIRVRVLVRDGFAAPAVSVWATHEGEPSYQRNVQTGGGDAEARLSGLGPGRFRVSAGGLTARGALFHEIDLDGANEVELVLDQR